MHPTESLCIHLIILLYLESYNHLRYSTKKHLLLYKTSLKDVNQFFYFNILIIKKLIFFKSSLVEP